MTARRVQAGGRRWTVGSTVVSPTTGTRWVVTGVMPDTYGPRGRAANLLTVRHTDKPGMENVLRPDEVWTLAEWDEFQADARAVFGEVFTW